jgi:hypothetical protein
MKRLLPIVLAVAAAQGLVAQDDSPMLDRSMVKWATGAADPMQGKSFDSGAYKAGKFEAGAFSGVKAAPAKEFTTRSFLGIKNPWLGKAVFDTKASPYAGQAARDGDKKVATDSYAIKDYESAGKTSPLDQERVLEAVEQKKAVVEPKAQGGVDQFTQNLSKELSIDDVRKLLNKGNGR